MNGIFHVYFPSFKLRPIYLDTLSIPVVHSMSHRQPGLQRNCSIFAADSFHWLFKLIFAIYIFLFGCNAIVVRNSANDKTVFSFKCFSFVIRLFRPNRNSTTGNRTATFFQSLSIFIRIVCQIRFVRIYFESLKGNYVTEGSFFDGWMNEWNSPHREKRSNWYLIQNASLLFRSNVSKIKKCSVLFWRRSKCNNKKRR